MPREYKHLPGKWYRGGRPDMRFLNLLFAELLITFGISGLKRVHRYFVVLLMHVSYKPVFAYMIYTVSEL